MQKSKRTSTEILPRVPGCMDASYTDVPLIGWLSLVNTLDTLDTLDTFCCIHLSIMEFPIFSYQFQTRQTNTGNTRKYY